MPTAPLALPVSVVGGLASDDRLMRSVQFPKEWSCPELRLADGTVIGSGVLSLTARGRLDLEVILSDVRTLGAGELTLTGLTDGGEVLTASLCAVTRRSGRRATFLKTCCRACGST